MAVASLPHLPGSAPRHARRAWVYVARAHHVALSAQKLVPAAYGGNAPSEDACLIAASDARNAHPYFFRKSMGFFMLSLQGAGGAQSCGLSPAVRSVRLSMAALPGHKGADRGTLLSTHGSAGGAERRRVTAAGGRRLEPPSPGAGLLC